jgi:hypothetical protein
LGGNPLVVVPLVVEFEEVLEVETGTLKPPAQAQQKILAWKSVSSYIPVCTLPTIGPLQAVTAYTQSLLYTLQDFPLLSTAP